MAARFRDRWGFRVFKLKGGVLAPDVEARDPEGDGRPAGPGALLRIDPNGRWKTATAIRIGKADRATADGILRRPRAGSGGDGRGPPRDRAEDEHQHVRDQLRAHSRGAQVKPIDVLLCDHHYFGGFAGCLALGPICTPAGWTMSQHSNNHAGITMAAMIHLAASIPELTLASDTHYPWLVDGTDIIEGPKLDDPGRHDGGSRRARPGRHARSPTRSPVHTRPIRSAGCADAMTDR